MKAFFVCFSDNDAKIKGEYQSVSGSPKDIRKKKRMRRIEEYKKFKANCQRLKIFIREKQDDDENIEMTSPNGNENKKRTKSMEMNNTRIKITIVQRRCFSMPNLNKNLTLQETILLWQMKKIDNVEIKFRKL